jgi:membrane-bound lytic murein transglycosylase D
VKATRRARFAATMAGAALILPPSASSAADSPRSVKLIRPGSTSREVVRGAENAELGALRAAERELFAPALAATALGSTMGGGDRPWLAQLETPDLPIRWDDRVVRYLEFFRDDPRGHATFATLYRHWGRFRELVRRTLREKALPEDLVWLSMIESGFDPSARSASGAAGLWQFMPETGRIYGLTMGPWLDQRYSADLETGAAADLLADLHRRFGSWELALAAYNMGHAGLASVVRRYNSNDFWALSRMEGALPWETTLYVPKILAASVIARNLDAFGFGGLALDPPVEADPVDVPPGTSFALVAQAAGCDAKEIEALNPEFRASRTPPAGEGDSHETVKVPRGKGAAAAQTFARLRSDPVLAASKGRSQNPSAVMTATESKVSVIVPSDEFVYPDRRRVFHRVLASDTLGEIASAMGVSTDDLCRWNNLDPSARLQEAMTLQAFVMPDADLSHIVVLPEEDVHVLAVGSEDFFAALEQEGRFKRVPVLAQAGDTVESIGKRFEVAPRTMERINRRGRSEPLKAGERVVVYVPGYASNPSTSAAAPSNAPTGGPLPAPLIPNRLP